MTALKYVGAGTYIHGVPARDLTEEEAAQYGALIREQEAAARVTLYERAAPEAPAATGSKRAAKEGAEGDSNG